MRDDKKGGRPPKVDPAQHRLSFRLNDKQWAEFMAMYQRSGMRTQSHFIIHRLFETPFRVVTADENTLNFYDSLKELRSECRKIGVNYNQFITILRQHFTEQKAAIMSKRSAELLQKVVLLNEQALLLTRQIIDKWLPK
ncbi:MAG: hypothetical protein SNF92_09410 [Rikenellaceae bacterium]